MSDEDQVEPRIVVGVDGSYGSRQALLWARDEAKVRGGTITAVMAWSPAPMAVGAGLPPRIPDTAPDASAREVLDLTVDEIFGADADVERRVEHGNAARVLIDLSEGADLIVVGGRGKSGFASAVHGSVSQQVAQHSHCPVVVLPSGS